MPQTENITEPTGELIQPPQELIVHIAPISMDGADCALLSVVPGDVNIHTLQLRWEDGGLIYRDGGTYSEWDGCRCEIVTRSDIPAKFGLLP